MNEIAFAVFGTCDGTNGFHSPPAFQLPSPLHRIIDTNLPFLFEKEVFRFYRVTSNDKESLCLLSLYQKIDDFGGPRDGAFAGVGIFVRNGTVDSNIVVNVLRDMLSNLIASASNGKQFTVKIQDAVDAGRIKPPAAASQLVSSFTQTSSIARSNSDRTGRALVGLNDTIISGPVAFFEINQFIQGISEFDVYYSNSKEFHDLASNGFNLNGISSKDTFRKYEQSFEKSISDLDRSYRTRIQEEKNSKEQLLNARALTNSNNTNELEKLKAKYKEDVKNLNLQINSLKSDYFSLSQANDELRKNNEALNQKLKIAKIDITRLNDGHIISAVTPEGAEIEKLTSILKNNKANHEKIHSQLKDKIKTLTDENDKLKLDSDNKYLPDADLTDKKNFSNSTVIKLLVSIAFLIFMVGGGAIYYFSGQDKAGENKTAQDKAAKDKATQDQAAKDQAAKDKATQDLAVQDQTAKDKAGEDKAAKDKATQDQAAKDKAGEDKAGEDKAVKDKAVKDKAAKDKATKDKADKDKAAKDKAPQDLADQDQTAKDKATQDQAAKDKAGEDKAVKDKAAKDKATKDKATEDKATEDTKHDKIGKKNNSNLTTGYFQVTYLIPKGQKIGINRIIEYLKKKKNVHIMKT
jgi:hypothetical protein